MDKAVKTHLCKCIKKFLNTSLSLLAMKNIVYVFGLLNQFDLYNLLNLAQNVKNEISN